MEERREMELTCIKDGIVRCRYASPGKREEVSMIIERRSLNKEAPVLKFCQENGDDEEIEAGSLKLTVSKKDLSIIWKDPDGRVLLREGKKEFIEIPVMTWTTDGEEPVIDRVKTVDGERNFIKNLKEKEDHKAWQGRLYFNFSEDEHIHGLGQGEDGIYDYRGHVQYLYQHNMRIPMPFFISDRGYGILFDCTSLMTFSDTESGSYMFFDTIPYLDYYFIYGKKVDEIIKGLRFLTGDAVMLPKWAFGYVQSKEQYHTADELLNVAEHYRELGIPIDCVVQDWNTWERDKWGNKILDKERYGNMKECSDKLHKINVHTMVSVWPNMNSGTENYEEFMAKNMMLNDLATYDAFNKEAGEVYWKQAKTGLFDKGFDSFWCDSTEPFSGPDWGGEIKREPWKRFSLVGEEHKKYLPPEKANAYSLAHAENIYENMRKDTDKRVLNLTRSGYAGSQRYGAMLWSGDTYASWETLKKQITEGINMGLSGYPYWTLDIGGFFTVGKKWQNRGCGCNNDPTPKWFWTGRYDEGVSDKGYRELYVRWLQFGVFLPMFRSHGTDTPREIWNFGEKGEGFYDAIADAIALRYRLMPYIYSLVGAVRLKAGTIMRGLIFDFPEDRRAAENSSEFMFGPALLVCPVTEPMYYEAENESLDREKKWICYLPGGSLWHDLRDGSVYNGGVSVKVDADISSIPVFVRGGGIVPMQQGLSYASEIPDTPLELHIFSGADGEFDLYDDAGDDYGYEEGRYELIKIRWEDSINTLTIGERKGSYEGMEKRRLLDIYLDEKKVKSIEYEGTEYKIHTL